MAAGRALQLSLLLSLLLSGPPGRVRGQRSQDRGRRFSDFKSCGDPECSMLMCWGKAVGDFTGPDCRFVNFKKGDSIHVYYKLVGGSPELWAGNVGFFFGYFPKDLVKIEQVYAKEELQVPADETDFVCFDGRNDMFDNYNVEELLGVLEPYNSGTEDAEKAPPHAEQPPEGSAGSEPKAHSSSAAEGGGPEHQPHADPGARAEAPSSEALEEMLQGKLRAPQSEDSRASTSQAASAEQKVDTYKLPKEMALGLKTKFGSTADAMVSDDEATALVTAPEGALDKAPDAEACSEEEEEEEEEEEGNGGGLDELPLLTFSSGEEPSRAAEPGLEEEDSTVAARHPSMGTGQNGILATWGSTLFSIVASGQRGTQDLEGSHSEGAQEGDPESSEQGKPQAVADYFDSENLDDFFVEVFKTNDENDSGMDTEPDNKENGSDAEEPESPLEAARHGGTVPHGSAASLGLRPLPAAGKGKDAPQPASENRDSDPQEAAVGDAEDTLREGRPGAQTSAAGPESGSALNGVGSRATEGTEGMREQESPGAVPPPGEDLHTSTPDGVQVAGGAAPGPSLHPGPARHQLEEQREETGLTAPGHPLFPPPDGVRLAGKLEEEVPPLGDRSRLQQRDAALRERATEMESAQHEAEERDPAEERELPDGAAAPGSHAQETEGDEERTEEEEEPEGDEELPEELLEDENAVSAKQSQEIHPEVGDGKPPINPRGSVGAQLGTIHPDPAAEENQQEPNVILVIEDENATAARQGDGPSRGLGSAVVGREDGGPPAPEISEPEGREKAPSPGPREALQKEDSVGVWPGGDSTGPVERPSGEPSEEAQKAGDPRSLGPFPAYPIDDLSRQSPLAALGEDWPIILSVFKDLEVLERFLKYMDVLKLEAMLQDMSLKLKAAQQESLPYNADKVLDKVFRASEAQILSAAEKMLDARTTRNRELGAKESNVLEEYAVLDDVQDLIYFVRYKHLAEEEPVPLSTAPTLEDCWRGPAQETQPPPSDLFPRENTEDAGTKLPEEPSPWGQPATRVAGGSAEEQTPNPKEDEAPVLGVITTEGPEADPGGTTESQQEMNRQEPAHTSPLESVVPKHSSFMPYLSKMLVATLPEDAQPGPDFYGLPWKPVLLTAVLGIISFAIFFWRTVLAVRERIYQVTEQQIAEKVKNTTKANTELVQKLSDYEQKIKESKKLVQDTKKENMILSEEAIKYKDKIKVLEGNSEILGDTAKNLRVMLESEQEKNVKNQDLILENRKSIEKLKDVIAVNASELSEVQIALNEAKVSEEKVKSECQQVQEENARLKKKKAQLEQEVKDWKKLNAELSEQITSFEKSQRELEAALAHKDDGIGALTNCIMQLDRLECRPESEGPGPGGTEADELANGEVGGDQNEMRTKIKQMLDVSRTQTAISVLTEDLKLLQAKLRASMSTKCDLEGQIEKLGQSCGVLQSTKAGLEEEYRTLRQKVEILNELYQQKEMALQKKLSQEEYELQERDQWLSAADEKVVLATEEVKVCKRRIQEMEEELQKTERSFKNQLATHEKKAHENWLKARSAERQLTEERREAANLRHKLLELTQKMAMQQDEPVIVKPMPGRPGTQNPPQRGTLSQNGSFGPFPMSLSGGECSPPLSTEPPSRPISGAFSRRDLPRNEFAAGPRPGPSPGPMVSSGSRGSSPAKGLDEGKTAPQEPSVTSAAERPAAVNMAMKGPPAFPGPPFMGAPLPPPVGYGPPPPLCGPFGPQPMPGPPPPFVPCMYPPLGLREFAPGTLPGHAPFRPPGPLNPRQYFLPGPRLPPPPSGPQDYPPPPAEGDSLPVGPREKHAPASPYSSRDSSQTVRQSP